MIVKIIKCSNPNLWYYYHKFPIETEVIEGIDKFNIDSEQARIHNTFAALYDLKDYYYSDDLKGYLAKSDCVILSYFTKPTAVSNLNTKWVNSSEQPKEVKSETKKHDQGKPDFTLIPQLALLEVAKVFTHGKDKYGKYNYSCGTDHSRYVAALLRHTNQYLTGQDIDESGAHHLACVAANALMALDNILTNKGEDDRNRVYKK